MNRKRATSQVPNLSSKRASKHVKIAFYWDEMPVTAKDLIGMYLGHRYLNHPTSLALRTVSKEWWELITMNITHIYMYSTRDTRKLWMFRNAHAAHILCNKFSECDKFALRDFPKIKTVYLGCVNPKNVEFAFANADIDTIIWKGSLHSNICLMRLLNWIKECNVKKLVIDGKVSYCYLCLPVYGYMSSLREFTMKHSINISKKIIRNICALPNLEYLHLENVHFNSHPEWQELIQIIDDSNIKKATLSKNLGYFPNHLHDRDYTYLQSLTSKDIQWIPDEHVEEIQE